MSSGPPDAVARAAAAAAPVLEVRGLRTVYAARGGPVVAVDGVDLDVRPGRTLGLVGESGCGKSALALSVLGLLPSNGRVVAGEVRFRGEDLLRASPRRLRELRARSLGAVFQDPAAALNPVLSVGEQVAEALRAAGCPRGEARARAVAALERVGLPDAARRYDDAPGQLSGGMRQRACLAMALAGAPELLVLDEPTTALDVTVQAQVLALLRDLQRDGGPALLLVTHDLGVVASCADDVAVLYAGRVVERGPVRAVLRAPRHPYTRLLLRAVPDLARPERAPRPVPGRVPDPRRRPTGCRFRDRCPLARADCAGEPSLAPVPGDAPEHRAACPHGGEELP